jgi:hypothetical protein
LPAKDVVVLHRCHHKPKAVAKVAAARKLAIRLFWMLRTNQTYPEVVYASLRDWQGISGSRQRFRPGMRTIVQKITQFRLSPFPLFLDLRLSDHSPHVQCTAIMIFRNSIIDSFSPNFFTASCPRFVAGN